jgi:E3 ubiquitin-protein ligase DOA10
MFNFENFTGRRGILLEIGKLGVLKAGASTDLTYRSILRFYPIIIIIIIIIIINTRYPTV